MAIIPLLVIGFPFQFLPKFFENLFLVPMLLYCVATNIDFMGGMHSSSYDFLPESIPLVLNAAFLSGATWFYRRAHWNG